MQLKLDELSNLLVSVVDMFEELKCYPGRNASVFIPADVLNSKLHSSYDPGGDQVTLERVNLLPVHAQSSDHGMAYVKSYCNDDDLFDSTHSELLYLRASAVT